MNYKKIIAIALPSSALLLYYLYGNQKKEPLKNDRVGLVNLGATCYLNSLLQCLFHIPESKKKRFSMRVSNGTITYELQKIFYKLILKIRMFLLLNKR